MCEFCGSGPVCVLCRRGCQPAIPVCLTAAHGLLCGRKCYTRLSRNLFAAWMYAGALAGFVLIVLATLVLGI